MLVMRCNEKNPANQAMGELRSIHPLNSENLTNYCTRFLHSIQRNAGAIVSQVARSCNAVDRHLEVEITHPLCDVPKRLRGYRPAVLPMKPHSEILAQRLPETANGPCRFRLVCSDSNPKVLFYGASGTVGGITLPFLHGSREWRIEFLRMGCTPFL